jgi:uncharacterized cofD-like protein
VRQGATTAQALAARLAAETDAGARPGASADWWNRAARVVALGGGTGLPVLLRGLRTALFPSRGRRDLVRDRDRLVAVVTAADDGGSSGRLRRTYRVTPPGDIRNCLLALSDGDPTLAAIFDFRFNGHDGQDVEGHSLGNLILTALSHLENDFLGGVERANHILGARGRVFPATLDDVRLIAEFTDGSSAEGESQIALARRLIRRVRLEPEGAEALPEAQEAISAADLIVIGPGSLYTSLIPVLLVRDLADAIARSSARVVLVMNLMTEPGETDDTDAADHLLAIRRHVPQVPIHDVLLNTATVPRHLTERYAAEGAVPIVADVRALQALGCRVVGRDLLAAGLKIRHDPHKLARAALELAQEVRR